MTMSQRIPIYPSAAASTSASPTTKSSSWDLPNPLLSPCFFKLSLPISNCSLSSSVCYGRETRPSVLRRAVWKEGSLEESPVPLHLEPILSETQFDRVVAEAQQLEVAFLVVWMASWCRKCIYLKPKLEKLAADYYPRLRFYIIDVNAVSHKLVVRAGVTKMPIIQLWKDSEKQAEVIGGHKAHLVINEVQEMIENECTI